MDTISHAVGGYLISASFGLHMEINIASAIFGALPDIIGYAEKIIKKDNLAWSWYEKAHNEWIPLMIIPSYGFHVLLDSFTHGEGMKWWKKDERLWMEILYWIILVIWTYILIKQ